MYPTENFPLTHAPIHSTNTYRAPNESGLHPFHHALRKHVLCAVEPTFCLVGVSRVVNHPLPSRLHQRSYGGSLRLWEMSLRVRERWQVTFPLRVPFH